MKDIFKAYKQKQIKKHLTVAGVSFMLALGVNLTYFGTNTSQLATANIFSAESTLASDIADITVTSTGEKNSITIGNTLEDVQELSFTLVYTPDLNIEVNSLLNENSTLTEISNTDGFVTLIFRFDNPTNIISKTDIVELSNNSSKLDQSAINIIEGNFTDSDQNVYYLSSSGTRL